MDLMGIRRGLMMGQKKDYLKGVEWVDGKYIASSGDIADNSSCHYTKDVLFLPQGEYVLSGKNGALTIYYRIHEYDENGAFVTQIMYKIISRRQSVELQFTAPQAPHGIKLSIASAFVGTLTKTKEGASL